MFKHFFISYARGDGEEFARKLHDDLEKLGFTAWLDVHDIPKGADWDTAIDDGLRNARAILVAMTPGSVASLQVKSEWNDGINRYLPVIPLLVQPCQVPRVLKVFNYIDFIKSFEDGFHDLVTELENIGINHLQYLKQTLRAFEVAQQESADPRRFRTKIVDLQNLIANWETRFESQEQRITSGLEQTKKEIIERSQAPSPKRRVRVVGQRPIDVTDFFKDRVRERETLRQLLGDGRTRLVSVIGRGGMGKTAVVTKVVNEIEQSQSTSVQNDTFIDGIAYLSTKTGGINLERIFHDGMRMLNPDNEKDLMKVWSNPSLTAHDKVANLLDASKDGVYIMMLDNMEDLLNESGEIADEDVRLFLEMSLVAPANIRLIVTSRIPLSLKREVTAFDKQVHLTDGLPTDDAVQLLRDLDPNGNYGLLDTIDEKLNEIASMTHGVPRALEVVVGLLANDPFTSPDDILNEFFKHEDVVKELIEENYKRLDRASRRVLEALAIYGRPVTQIAVDYLLVSFEQGLNVPMILRRLINTHIVTVDRAAKTVSLHPIDQDYAYSQIPEGPRQEHLYNLKSLNSRAADYYAQISVRNDDWLSINDIEFQILEIEHRLRAEEYDLAAIALGTIDKRMAARYAKKAKVLRDQVAGKIGDQQLQLDHELKYAEICQMLGMLEEAAFSGRNAVDLARELKDTRTELASLLMLCEVMRFLGYIDEAARYIAEAEIISVDVDDAYLRTRLFWTLSINSTYNKQYHKAVEYNYLMLKYAIEMNDPEQIAAAHNVLGINYIALRQYDKALDHTEAALKLYREENQRDGMIYIYNMLGMIHLGQGKVDEAFADFNQGLVIAREDNNLRPEGLCLYNLARAYWVDGDLNATLEHANSSAKILYQIGANYAGAAQRLADAVRASQAHDKSSEARSLMSCAKETSVNADLYDPLELAQAALSIAESEGFEGIAKEARDFIDSSLTLG